MNKILFTTILALMFSIAAIACNGGSCDKGSCSTQKSCDTKSSYESQKSCNTSNSCSSHHNKGKLVKKIYFALQYIELKEEQIQDIKLATHSFKKSMRSLRGENVDYLESFKSDEVDAKLFKEAFMKKFDKIVEAKFDYIDIIYSILDKEQKRKLIKELRAIKRAKALAIQRRGESVKYVIE